MQKQSPRGVLYKVVLRNLKKITGKHLCLFFNKVASLSHWITFSVNGNKKTYFNSFGVEYIPKEIRKSADNTKNIYRIQANDSAMCGYFCIEFIDFILSNKRFAVFTNLSCLNNSFNNEKSKTFLTTLYNSSKVKLDLSEFCISDSLA